MKESARGELVVGQSPNPTVSEEDGVAVLDAIAGKLASIAGVAEAKEVADQAEAFRQYAKRARKALTVQNRCAFVKVCAERRAGQLLAEMELPRGRPKKTSTTSTLSDLDINRNQSSRWQALATIPVETIALWRKQCDDNEQDFTGAYVTRMMKASMSREAYLKATRPWDWESTLNTTVEVEAKDRLFKHVRAFVNRLGGGDLYMDMGIVLTSAPSTVSRFDLNLLGDEFSECSRHVATCIEALGRRLDGDQVVWDQKESVGGEYLKALEAFRAATIKMKAAGFDGFTDEEHDQLAVLVRDCAQLMERFENALWTIRVESKRPVDSAA